MIDSRLAVFIDGLSLHHSARALGFEIDYRRLLSYVNQNNTLLRAYYYMTIFEDRDHQTTRPLLDWLEYNGFTVRTKPVKEFDDGEGRRKSKRNIAVNLAIDALSVACHIDRLMLFSGDGDFRRLIEVMQRRGVHTTIISTVRTAPPMLADELRRQADDVLELDDLRSQIARQVKASRANN
jgi:uncharacterized LabA/DUF88 family protein